jgi:uncharacterized protein YbjT (DUF2867 family)
VLAVLLAPAAAAVQVSAARALLQQLRVHIIKAITHTSSSVSSTDTSSSSSSGTSHQAGQLALQCSCP